MHMTVHRHLFFNSINDLIWPINLLSKFRFLQPPKCVIVFIFNESSSVYDYILLGTDFDRHNKNLANSSGRPQQPSLRRGTVMLVD